MKRHISIFAFLLSAFAAVGLSAFADGSGSDVMRLTPVGYRLGEAGGVTAYDPSIVTITPGDTSIVVSNKSQTLTAVLNRDYKVVRWQKFADDPTVRTEVDPIEEFGEKSETVSVDFNPRVEWMYVTVVVEYDPVRTVKASLSSFAKGTVTISPEKTSYQKGDVVTLTAQPEEGCAFVRWSDGNADHMRTLTVDGDIDLKAYIEPISSRVSFSAGAGAVLDVTSKRVSFGKAYGELPVPTRTGARFSGWADADARTVTAKTEVSRVADHTLYAQWGTDLYEIAWDFTGRGNGKVDGAGTYAYGSQPTLKAVPYEGSTFVGWTDGVTLNPRRITVLSNALYVAQFDIATYDVTFTYRDAAGNLVTTATNVAHGAAAKAPEVPEWPEHTFRTWSTEEYRKVTRDLAVEAIYDAQTHQVMFAYHDWQGNCVTTMPQHVIAGGKANPPDRSVVDNWSGHTFKGWEPDYNVIRQDTLCEAIYETNTYEVTFTYHGKDGEFREQVEMVQHGGMVQAVPETAVVDNWPGHRFLGWSNEDYLRPITGNLEVFARYEGYCTIIYGDALGTNYWDEVKDPKDWATLRPIAELSQMEGYAFKKTGYLFDYWSEKRREGTNTVVFTYADQAKVPVQSGDVLALKSEWKPITYKVRFDGNGGKCNMPDADMTYDVPHPNIPVHIPNGSPQTSRENYTLLGWSQDPVGESGVLGVKREENYISLTINTNLTATADDVVKLYAIWQVEVVINGIKTNVVCGSQLPQPADPVKTGYTFAGGWTTNGGVHVTFPITVTGSFDLKSEDKWTTNKYSVVFHGTDADGGAMEPQVFTYDVTQALTPNGFTRTGHTFDLWTNEVGTAFVDGARVKNLATNDGAVVDLYATWTMNPRYYAVRFNPNGGADDVYVQAIECGVETALTPNRFARTGYGFANWTNATGTVYTDGAKVTDLAAEGETNELYAAWTPNSYWVKFDGNTADDGEMDNQEFAYDVAQALTSNAFTKTGHTFAGWAAAESSGSSVVYADGAVVSNLTAEVNATNTLFAAWTPNKYTVVIDGVSTEMDCGSDIGKPADPAAREGYTFTDWTTNGVPVAAWPLKVPLGGLDIRSAWTANAYTVRFDPGEGTGEMGDQSFVYDVPQNLAANAFTAPERKVFDCWTNVAGDAYADCAFVTNLVAEGVCDLYAVWTDAPSYTMRFNANGGAGEPYMQNFLCGRETALTSNRFARAGYGFANWTNATGTVYADGEKVTDLAAENATNDLYAAWTPNKYWVAFEGNGADGGKMDNQEFTYDVAQALTSNAFTRTGHAFAGWATNETGKAVYSDGAVLSNLAAETDATNTLWATWTAKSYEISFNSAGGSAVGPVTNEFGKVTSAPAEPTRTGHQFAGWYRGEVKYEFGQPMPAENFVLTAHWTANAYTVRFNPGEGTGEMGDQPFVYDVPQNLTANAFTAPELKVFDCWTNAAGDAYADSALVTNLVAEGVCDLYAVWTDAPSYTVRFNPNDGEGEAYTQNILCGRETALTPNRFARTGYGFANWTNATGTVYADGEKVTDLAAENATNDLYAAWTPNKYWVAFEGNGAAGGKMDNQEFTYDVAQALTSNAFTKTGHAFAGWAAAEGSGSTVAYADGAFVSNLTAEANATNTLWATWTPNHYAVRFNPNGGSGGVTTQDFTYDQPQELRNNTFEPPEVLKSFAGWATNETGEAIFADQQIVSNLTAEADGTVNLYAVWVDDSYTVTFDGNDATGGSMEQQIFKHGGTGTLTPNAYVRTGYGFKNWTNDFNKVYSDGASFTAPATGSGETLYAVWTNKIYNCTFTERSEDNQLRKYGEKLDPLPRDPAKTGYTFEGWTTNGSDIVNLSTFTMPDHDVAFGSKWKPIKYTVEFYGSDGSYVTQGTMESQEFTYDVEQALSSNKFTRTGYEFTQWTNTVGGVFTDGQKDKNYATTDGAIVKLYAVWQKTGNSLSVALGAVPSDWNTISSPDNCWTPIGKAGEGVQQNQPSSDGDFYLEIPFSESGNLVLTFSQSGGADNEPTVKFNNNEIEIPESLVRTYNLAIPKSGKLRFEGAPDKGIWTLKFTSWTPSSAK